jgi:branched-chain amino acid aminotransferase
MAPLAYINGTWLPEDEATISIRDRGFLFGDGVFETGRLHGGKFFRLRQHLERLHASAAIMRLAVPPLDELTGIATKLAEHNAYQEASLRITVTGGVGGRGLHRAGSSAPTVIATLGAIATDWLERAQQGWRVQIATIRRPAEASMPAQLKSLGRTYALLAHLAAEANGFDDALLLSHDGFIAEGPTWNVFWRRGNTVFTPALESGILAGVTRSIMLDLARAAGYSTEEVLATPAELARADEAFATMTSSGIVPLRQIDERMLTGTPAAARLQTEYWSLVRRETDQTE